MMQYFPKYKTTILIVVGITLLLYLILYLMSKYREGGLFGVPLDLR